MQSKRLSPSRAAVVVLAAVLVAVVAITPSLAGSFLTKQGASKMFLSAKSAKHNYLTKRQAQKTFLPRVQAPNEPVVATQGSTAPFGPVGSTTSNPLDVPASYTSFKMKEGGLVVLTFSGVSECKASTNGVPCNVQLIVDGSPAGSTGKVPFDLSSANKPSLHSLTQTTFLTPGNHVAWVQYSGSTDSSVTFKLSNWNLVVQGYPGS